MPMWFGPIQSLVPGCYVSWGVKQQPVKLTYRRTENACLGNRRKIGLEFNWENRLHCNTVTEKRNLRMRHAYNFWHTILVSVSCGMKSAWRHTKSSIEINVEKENELSGTNSFWDNLIIKQILSDFLPAIQKKSAPFFFEIDVSIIRIDAVPSVSPTPSNGVLRHLEQIDGERWRWNDEKLDKIKGIFNLQYFSSWNPHSEKYIKEILKILGCIH